MMGAVEEDGEKPLIEQGNLTFNDCIVSTNGAVVSAGRGKTAIDAYNVKRYFNLTTFSDNTATGTGNAANISNKRSGQIIPAGATCVFSVADVACGTVGWSAVYSYVCALIRDTSTGNLMRIGICGNNKPAATTTWTAQKDTEIGCIALEYSHSYQNCQCSGKLSLLVNGEEWLP